MTSSNIGSDINLSVVDSVTEYSVSFEITVSSSLSKSLWFKATEGD